MQQANHDTERRSVQAAEKRLAAEAPGFLERVRDASARLAVHDATDAAAAVAAVEDLSVLDIDVPTASRLPMVALIKRAVKSLVAWYLRYFGRQISAFGQAVANLGQILVDRTDLLEESTSAIRADLSELTRRVEHLEAREGTRD